MDIYSDNCMVNPHITMNFIEFLPSTHKPWSSACRFLHIYVLTRSHEPVWTLDRKAIGPVDVKPLSVDRQVASQWIKIPRRTRGGATWFVKQEPPRVVLVIDTDGLVLLFWKKSLQSNSEFPWITTRYNLRPGKQQQTNQRIIKLYGS